MYGKKQQKKKNYFLSIIHIKSERMKAERIMVNSPIMLLLLFSLHFFFARGIYTLNPTQVIIKLLFIELIL